MMKRGLAFLLAVFAVCVPAVSCFAFEAVGQVLSTDIRAFINGAEIPAYNIDGKLAVIVADLNSYGFRTVYNDGLRKTSVTRNPDASLFTSVPSRATGLPVGTRVMDVYRSDITVELDGVPVPAVNVENRMAIFFSDLKGYGSYTYDNASRTSSIVLSGAKPAGKTEAPVVFTPNTIANRQNFVMEMFNSIKAVGYIYGSYPGNPFSDVDSGTKSYQAILWAYHQGIVDCDESGLFRPLDPITREEACTYLARLATIYGVELPKKYEAAEYTDSSEISSWAVEAVFACAQAGIIKGYTDGSFRPQGVITNSEVAQIIYIFTNLLP